MADWWKHEALNDQLWADFRNATQLVRGAANLFRAEDALEKG